MKKTKYAFIVIAVILVVFLTAFLVKKAKNSRYIPGDVREGLCSFEFNRSGGMNGESYNLTIYVTADGNIAAVQTDQPFLNKKEEITRKIVSKKVFTQIEEIIRTIGMNSWENNSLPDDPIEVLDAPTSSVRISMDGKNSYFSDSMILPDGGWEAVGKIMNLIKESLK